jgi:hypothetical protein
MISLMLLGKRTRFQEKHPEHLNLPPDGSITPLLQKTRKKWAQGTLDKYNLSKCG